MSTENQTWIDPEERAYPKGGFTRRGRAILRENPHNPVSLPYGSLFAFKASIPDTYFTIPARIRWEGVIVRGYLSSYDGIVTFTPEATPAVCKVCADGDGCRS